MSLTEFEKKIIEELQNDIPLEPYPFAKIAKNLGIDEIKLLEQIKNFIKKGVIRRFGGTIFHDRSGFEANVMVAWEVTPNKVEEVGQAMAALPEVTHCYARLTYPNWPYNLYTMIHGRNEEECLNIVKKNAIRTEVKQYRLLFTENTFKRTSMNYF